ncbi:hypothetical protein NEIRO03_2662 [Nematocida sp. AWRm78]|nr:hypothetical protein NEIRO03_2662 [Nematocida sp. AWRm78]
MTSIPEYVKKEIKRLYSSGMSQRKIAREMGVSKTSVQGITAGTAREGGSPPQGRPPKVTPRIARAIVRAAKTPRVPSTSDLASQAQESAGVALSRETVRQVLHSEGLVSRVRPRKPRLLPHHRLDRLSFAHNPLPTPEDTWQSVVFTDECKFNLFGSDGPKTVWREPGPPTQDYQIIETVKYGGGSVMAWGAITSRGVGALVFIETTMDAKVFVEVFESGLNETLKKKHLKVKDVILQQDNDPKHKSALARRYMEKADIRVLRWPSYSPDLNPIENVWAYLKRQIARSGKKPQDKRELKALIADKWRKIPDDFIRHLYDGMPGRMEDVIAHGGKIIDH